MTRKFWLGLLLTLTVILIIFTCIFEGCGKGNDHLTVSQNISLEQAEKTLNKIVEYASHKDLGELCSLGASLTMTERQLKDAGGWESLPSQYPKITDTYTIDPKTLNNSTILGGRILVLEGTTGLGKSYRTEFFVAFDLNSNKILVQYPIYWSGIGIGDLDDSGVGISKSTPRAP